MFSSALQGGLATSFQSLRANLPLSTAIALTGIALPISLSFTLGGLANASPLQSFAAGAALCSTSLGTTFTILGTTGLLKTRLGVVLTSAAMMDDVVGLVMVQVISNLGDEAAEFSAVTVVRPVFVSLGFALVCPAMCWLVAKPVTLWLNAKRKSNREALLNRTVRREGVMFCVHTLLLLGMITGATYAGTSGLFAAYLTGAMISWWDSEVPHPVRQVVTSSQVEGKDHAAPSLNPGTNETSELRESLLTGPAIYEKYYQPANNRILKPFFFVRSPLNAPI
jgi:Kef-type K+ transport system membrane component KefB